MIINVSFCRLMECIFFLLLPTKSILKKSDDTINFNILQDENTTTNVLGSLWENDTTRNFDEMEITENGDRQKRRKSTGRRVQKLMFVYSIKTKLQKNNQQ